MKQEVRPPSPDDDDDIDKAINLIHKTMNLNKEIYE